MSLVRNVRNKYEHESRSLRRNREYLAFAAGHGEKKRRKREKGDIKGCAREKEARERKR